MTPDSATRQGAPRVALSEAAVTKLREIITSYPEPVAGLRLKIVGRTAKGFEHVLTIVEEGYELEGDAVIYVSDLTLFVEGSNAAYLDGVAIHYEDHGPDVSGLEFENPNPLWFDANAQKIQELFDQQVNPAIAAHGGWVQLLDVDGAKAYIEMGGGCQGCGQRDVTLKQGIEASIRAMVPAIEEVFDTTDHAAGANPYFQSAKK